MDIKESINDIIENNTKEAKKTVKKKKISEFNLGILRVSEEIIEKDDEIRKSIVSVNGEEFETEIVFDNGRDRYRAAIIKNGRKVSLSFFNTRKIAYKAVLISVAALNGVKIKDTGTNLLENC
jgi:hypothetical protein